jgi:alpha-tubulin suppressor-like RCC1 family protein
MAIKSNGLLFTWGFNIYGQLGNGGSSFYGYPSPIQVGSSSWTAVSGFPSGVSVGAIRQDGKLFTWGYNGSGRLGDGTTTNSSSPVQIGSGSWTAVDMGGLVSLGIK